MKKLLPAAGKLEKISNPFSKQPSYDSRKNLFHGGESHGTGIRQKVGSLKEFGGKEKGSKKFGKPPKSLA